MAELKPSYPLAESDAGDARTSSGRKVGEITLNAVVRGEIGPDDIRISAEVLRLQAEFAQQGGNPQLADNLRRGAELVALSDGELLDLYESLRPGRSSALELEQLAQRLEAGGAVLCAALVLEGARRVRAPRARFLGNAHRRGRRRQLHDGGRHGTDHPRRGSRLPRGVAGRDHRGEGLDSLRRGREQLVARAERRLGEPVHRLLLAELDPVDTGLVELGRLEELDLARNAVVRPVSETPSGAGAASGRLRRLAELDGDPDADAVLAIVLDEDFEEAAAQLRAARDRGHRIAGVVVQGDDAVLIGNRFDRVLPIVDEVTDAASLPTGAQAALEVAVPGATVSELSDPLQLAELLRLGPDEARAARHAARAVAGRRTALVVREAGVSGSAAEAIDTTVRLLFATGRLPCWTNERRRRRPAA